MKKIIFCIIFSLVIGTVGMAACHCSHCSHCGHSHSHGHHPTYSGGESHPVYLVNKESHTEKHNFQNCDKHYVMTETTIYHYSDGTRRVYTNSTIYNSDGTPIVENCQMANHVILENKHYFIVRKNRVGQILDETGTALSERKYSYIEVLQPNRLLVGLDKKYGIIDISENIIVPIKYQKFTDVGYGLFVTRLNGYYGILDINNNQLVDNDCERIKPLYDTYVLKKYGKYGLVSKEGKLLLEPAHDKIKKLGEYILVRDNNLYSVLDMCGNSIDDNKYKKVRLERNTLQGMNEKEEWSNLSTGLQYNKD